MEGSGGTRQRKLDNQSTWLNPRISSPSPPSSFPDSWFWKLCESLGGESWFKIFENFRVCSLALGKKYPKLWWSLYTVLTSPIISGSAHDTPWSLELRCSQAVTLTLASSLTKSFSLQCISSEVSTPEPCILAIECLNMNASLCSKLIPMTFGQSFHGPRNVSSQPQWHFISFLCNSSSHLPYRPYTLELQDLKLTAGFDSPATDHTYIKTSRGREARSAWSSGRKPVTLRRQTSVPFCVTRHTTVSCDLKCGVSSYSGRNMTGPVPVRLVSMPPVPVLLSLLLL